MTESQPTAPLQTKALLAHERLAATYGAPIPFFSSKDPLSELVSALLSHRTRNRESGRAYRELRARFPTWEAVRDAPTAEVEAAIAAAQWPEQKAPRIQAALRAITERNHGVLTLDFLADMSVTEARAWLEAIGATGRTLDIATYFLQIVVPSTPLLALGMALSGILRAAGDARRSMYVTLAGGAAAAILDPLFIFVFDLGVTGAAIATVLSRAVLAGIGFHGVLVVHKMAAPLDLAAARRDVAALSVIAVPAMLTNVATPVGNAFVTWAIAPFGDSAVAGWAVIGRLIPVAFGAIFALSGAIGPILGQNLGAGLIDRVKRTVFDALLLILGYCLFIWAALFLARHWIVGLFDVSGAGADLVIVFCTVVSAGFLFNRALFVANASFNNLGQPILSTVFNWGRATIGTVPFVLVGAAYAGANGVLIGQALGGVVFGVLAVVFCFRAIDRIARRAPMPGS